MPNSACFGKYLPEILVDPKPLALSVSTYDSVELYGRSISCQKTTADSSFIESVVIYMLAKKYLSNELNEDIQQLKDILVQELDVPISIDRLWLGRAAKKLITLREKPMNVDKYLSEMFRKSLSASGKIPTKKLDQIDPKKLIQESEMIEVQKGKIISFSTGKKVPHEIIKSGCELYGLYCIVKVVENPPFEDYGELLTAKYFLDSIYSDKDFKEKVPENVVKFFEGCAGAQLMPVGWEVFCKRQIKSEFELFEGKFCASSIIDYGLGEMQNGGVLLFWQRELATRIEDETPFVYYLTCQLSSVFSLDQIDFLICSEKICS